MTPPLEIRPLSPPFELANSQSLTPGTLQFGSILLCHVHRSPAAGRELAEVVARLRHCYPMAPVVAVLDESHNAEARDVIRSRAFPHIRAVVAPGEITIQALRRRLTEPGDVAAQLGDWVIRTQRGLSWSTQGLLPPLLEALPLDASTASVYQRTNFLRQARDHLRRDRLPPPARWRKLVRCLRAALAAQRDPEANLAGIAVLHGFSDQSGLNNAFRRVFDLTPREARMLLSWEWLAGRFLRDRMATRFEGANVNGNVDRDESE